MIQVQFPLADQIDRGLEFTVLQPGSPDVQFLRGDAEISHLGGRHGESHGDYPSGVSGHPDQRSQGVLCASAVNGQGRPYASVVYSFSFAPRSSFNRLTV